MKAKSCTIVMPGSLSLKLVHSGVWTGIRALASASNCSKLRSSSCGTVSGIGVSLRLEDGRQPDALAPLAVHGTRIGRVRRHADVVQRDARLPREGAVVES